MAKLIGMSPKERFLRAPTGYDIIEAQMDRYNRAAYAHQAWADVASTCVQFFEGNQWTAEERAKLRDEGRPCMSLNKIAPLVRLLLGYFRQNRYDAIALPGNDGRGTQEGAEAMTAVLKQISEMNQSDWNDAQVMQDGLQTGRGFWDIRMDFSKNRLGEVKEYVLDPFTTLLDPEADTYDPDGWGFVIQNRWVSPSQIWMTYGDEGLEDIDAMGDVSLPVGTDYDDSVELTNPGRYFAQTTDFFFDNTGAVNLYSSPFDHCNLHRKLIRVIDCQHKMLKRQRILIDTTTGVEKAIPDTWERNKIARVLEWSAMKGLQLDVIEEPRKVIRWTVTAGDRVLHDKFSPYDDFTVVPYFPYFRRGQTRGMIHDLLDPQREINRRSSAVLHIVMTTANSGWMVADGSLEEEMMEALEYEGSRPGLVLKYDSTKPIPQRIQPGVPPTAMKNLEMDANNNLKEISGVNDSALGNLDRVQSGRAIQARQQQAVIGAEVYFDNFGRSKELKARREVSCVQNFYTEERIVRIRSGQGGQPEQVVINRKTAAGEIVNNISYGTYDIAIDKAPLNATFLQGQFDEAMDLIEAGVPIPPDILIELSSLPMKDAIKARMDQDRMIKESNDRLNLLGLSTSIGIPPGQPAPPFLADGNPAVAVAPQGTPPSPSMGATAPIPPLENPNQP